MVDWRLCQRSYGKRQDTPTSLSQGKNRDSLPVTLAFTPTINLDLPVKLTCSSVNPILNMNIHFCLKQWSLANLKSINILHWKHGIRNKHNSINYKNLGSYGVFRPWEEDIVPGEGRCKWWFETQNLLAVRRHSQSQSHHTCYKAFIIIT